VNIGFVSTWCNRGRSVVTRGIREIAAGGGHQTFVLAHPPNEAMAATPADVDDWPLDGVTLASQREIPRREYEAWASACELDVIVCDMNLQLKEIERLRRRGIATVGRFVWERFLPRHARGARRAYDIVYSLTHVEQARYARLGISSPYIPWGVHPSTFADPAPLGDEIRLLYHLGMQGPRKPTATVLRAFESVDDPRLRLVVKAQAQRGDGEVVDTTDERVTYLCEDLSHDAYRALMGSSHVLVAPSRWEGLGVHLYEALGAQVPVIANAMPPIDEVVLDGVNGLLGRSHPQGRDRAGFRVHEPDEADLARCFDEIRRPGRLAALRDGVRRVRDTRPWSATAQAYRELFDRVS
jgi:glycosyltransferase involved in cell wall biosynthesis